MSEQELAPQERYSKERVVAKIEPHAKLYTEGGLAIIRIFHLRHASRGPEAKNRLLEWAARQAMRGRFPEIDLKDCLKDSVNE